MLLSSGAGADTGSGLRIRAQERSEGWKCSLGVTAIVRAFAKDGPKSVEVRWEAVVNQNPGDQNFGETVEEERMGRGAEQGSQESRTPRSQGKGNFKQGSMQHHGTCTSVAVRGPW